MTVSDTAISFRNRRATKVVLLYFVALLLIL